MDNVTLERYWNDPGIQAELEAAARRERARVLKRFLEESAQALLGPRSGPQPCEAC